MAGAAGVLNLPPLAIGSGAVERSGSFTSCIPKYVRTGVELGVEGAVVVGCVVVVGFVTPGGSIALLLVLEITENVPRMLSGVMRVAPAVLMSE